MEISKLQARFLKVARSSDSARPALLNIWSDPRFGALFSANGFKLHALKKPCSESVDVRPMEIDGRTVLSLVKPEEATKPYINNIQPKVRKASMYVDLQFLISTLKSLDDGERNTLKITIGGDGEDKLTKLEICGTCDEAPFYVVIMGVDTHSIVDKFWMPYTEEKEGQNTL